MQMGTSGLLTVEGQPRERLAFGQDYVRIKIVDTQLYYPAGFFVRAGQAVVSTTVSASNADGQAQVVRSLHTVAQVVKHTCIHTGLQPNLTAWLPVRTRDAVKLAVTYTVVRDPAFSAVIEQIGKLGLVSELSLFSPQIAVAFRITEIVGRMLDFLNQANREDALLELGVDLNLAELEAGYYAVLGSLDQQEWPRNTLRLAPGGRFDDSTAARLAQLSYVLLRVLRLPTQANEDYPGEAWWQALQAALDAVRATATLDPPAKVLAEWQANLRQVRALARQAHAFHLAEIQARMQTAQLKVLDLLGQGTVSQAASGPSEIFSEDLRDLFGVQTEEALIQSVRDYADAVEATRQLLRLYAAEL